MLSRWALVACVGALPRAAVAYAPPALRRPAALRLRGGSAPLASSTATDAGVSDAWVGGFAGGDAAAAVAGGDAIAAGAAGAADRWRVLFVLGGPGAGKGTQCARLAAEFGMVHLSAGELLRAERASGSAEGAMIDEYIREGRIVPVAVSLGLVRRAMRAAGACRFLVDGFPRNFDNVDGWAAEMGASAAVDGVLFFDCDEAELERRVLGRGEGRTDDNVASARKRFATFAAETMPVVEHYEAAGLLTRLDGARELEAVWRATRAAAAPHVRADVLRANGAPPPPPPPPRSCPRLTRRSRARRVFPPPAPQSRCCARCATATPRPSPSCATRRTRWPTATPRRASGSARRLRPRARAARSP